MASAVTDHTVTQPKESWCAEADKLEKLQSMKISSRDRAEAESSSTDQEIICGECKERTAIYQCPQCSIRTCSLNCCKGHKQHTGCSGKRNRGAFVPVSKMTDGTVRSDYFFLEEVLEQIPRNGKRARTHQEASPGQAKSKKMQRLVQQAERRGIMLQVMPPMMVRHKSNSSWYCPPRDTITWKVEAIVCPSKTSVHFNLSENEENILSHVSKQIQKEGIPIPSGVEFCLFLLRLPSSAKNPRYVEISDSDSLKTILRGMTIVEHPTLYLVPKEMRGQFPTGSETITELQTAVDNCDDTEMR